MAALAVQLTLFMGLTDMSASGSGGLKLDVEEKATLCRHTSQLIRHASPQPCGSPSACSPSACYPLNCTKPRNSYACLWGGGRCLSVCIGGLCSVGRASVGIHSHTATIKDILQGAASKVELVRLLLITMWDAPCYMLL